jgi:citrate synthase
MTNTHPLSQYPSDHIVTRVGAAFPGERAIFRGRDIHKEVVHDTNWLQLLSDGAGRRMTKEQTALLDFCIVSTNYPDPRVWNNRVASLAGSARSTSGLALGAANAVSEATIYGRRNEFKAVAFFRRIFQAVENGATIEESINHHLQTQGNIPGYGRPLHNGDERIAPLMQKAQELGVIGPHVRLAFEIEEYLLTTGKPLKMNLAALFAAFGADFGMTARQWTTTVFAAFLAGMIPCYLEALEEKPVGAMFAYTCDEIEYTGPESRDW